MGYRQYFYELDKTFVKKIKACKTENDLLDLIKKEVPEACENDCENDYVALYHLGKTLFEFGAYYENANEMYKHGDSLFSTTELNERYQDERAIIVDKEGVKCAIEFCRNKIIEMYEDLLKEKSSDEYDDTPQLERLKQHAKLHLRQWKPEYGDYTAYNLDENSDTLSESWLYEHQIFDLVRIYKTFDFENKCIVFMGW